MFDKRVLWFLALAACGGKTTEIDSDAAADSAADAIVTPDAGPPPGDDASFVCNTVSLIGGPVDMQAIPSTPTPMAGGGAIEAGEYVLDGYTIYTGPNGSGGVIGQAQITARITLGDTSLWEVASQTDNKALNHASYSGVVTAPGTIVLTPLCPATTPDTPPSTYFTDGTVIIVRTPGGGSDVVDVSFSRIVK